MKIEPITSGMPTAKPHPTTVVKKPLPDISKERA